jgi:Tol biopolymer transport system component
VAQGADGGWGLYVRRIDEEDFHLLTASGSPFRPRFSPDGAWLVFHDSPDRGVKRIAVAGGAVQTLVPGSGFENIDLDWTRDGTILIGSARGLRRIPATGGTPTFIREGEFGHVQALPGGGVLFSDVVGGAAIRYLPSDGSEPIDVVAGASAGRFVDAGGGVILYTDAAGTLWALPFDARQGRTRGVAVQVADGISEGSTGPRFSVSSSGTLVYARGQTALDAQRFDLLVVHLDGRESRLPLTPRWFGHPRWSPQGDQLAFRVDESLLRSQLFTYDVQLGTAPRRLTEDGSVAFPAWSPDGRSIAVANSAGTSGDPSDIAIIDAAGGGAMRTVRRAPGTQSHLLPQQWTRDNQLVFEVFEDAGRPRSVWRMDPADSSSAAPYLATEASVRSPRVSSQGDLVAYVSEQRVFVRRFPQPGPAAPAPSSQNGHAPAWSPDGNRLYFWKSVFTQPGASAVPDSLFVATVRRQPALSVDPPRLVLEGFFGGRPDWDLHPDGNRFVIARPVGAGQGTTTAAVPRYFIATNWFRELEAALAAVRKP